MSVINIYPKIENSKIEIILKYITSEIHFNQKSDRSVEGCYFIVQEIGGEKRIRSQRTKENSTIIPYTYMVEKISETHSKLTTIAPYHKMSEMMYLKNKDMYEKQNPGKKYERPPPIAFDGPKREVLEFDGALRSYQVDDCAKIIKRMETIGTCLFIADPGYGKTVVMCYVAGFYKAKTLIVVPNVALSFQTMKELKSRFPKANLIAYENRMDIGPDVDIVVTYAPRIDGNFELFKQFELVVLDEIHMLSCPTFLAGILSTSPKRILGLTATPGAKNEISEMFVGEKAFESNHVKSWTISFPRIKSGLEEKTYANMTGYTDALNDIASSKIYIRQIISFIKFFLQCNERIIAVTMRVELNQSLSEFLEMEGIDHQILSPSSKQCRNCDVIIGTHKMIGTGFDLSNYIENFDGKGAGVVIFLGSIKDDTLMYQICGRAFRSVFSHAVFPIVEDIKVFRNHGEKQIKNIKSHEGCKHKEGFTKFLESLAEEEIRI